MSKFRHYYGIEISKDVFDAVDEKGVHRQYKNDLSGFKKFFKQIQQNACCVMEATGDYHVQLADYLYYKDVLLAW